MTDTTDPNDLCGWVAELSNYQGSTIGHKMAHRLKVLTRFRNQVLEEAASLMQDRDAAVIGRMADNVPSADAIRELKWENELWTRL